MNNAHLARTLLSAGIFSLTLAACSSSSPPATTAVNDAPQTQEPPVASPPLPTEPTTSSPSNPTSIPPGNMPGEFPTLPPTNTPGTPTTNPVVEVPTGTEDIEPTGIISGASIGLAVGTYFQGTPPAAVGSIVLNALTSNENLSAISGGSSELSVQANQPYSTVYVLSDDGGYFLIQLDEATINSNLVISYSTFLLDAEQVEIGVQVSDAQGATSAEQAVSVSSIAVGTGDLQVSVSWDQPTDVDLYLTEPDGNVINFISTGSPSGGQLDLDSNPFCFIDDINNENITYDGFVPPAGEYIVLVDYFSACDITTPTNFVVTVRANGTVQRFFGELLPPDAFSAPREVARFVVQ
ncbi:MAG: pre-peptidase C-terminal domain-containing protein [Granulosicoccus sp.]